ncbi:hypothetical protein DZJ_22240 [Dickeya ananatis]
MIPVALFGSVAFLLIMLRYVSIRLIPMGQDNIMEGAMIKTLNARTRVFLSSLVESMWAAGVGGVVGHLVL